MKKVNVQVYEGDPSGLSTKDNNNWFITSAEYNDEGKIASINSMVNSEGSSMIETPDIPQEATAHIIDTEVQYAAGGLMLVLEFSNNVPNTPFVVSDFVTIDNPVEYATGDIISAIDDDDNPVSIKFIKDFSYNRLSAGEYLDSITQNIVVGVPSSYWVLNES